MYRRYCKVHVLQTEVEFEIGRYSMYTIIVRTDVQYITDVCNRPAYRHVALSLNSDDISRYAKSFSHTLYI